MSTNTQPRTFQFEKLQLISRILPRALSHLSPNFVDRSKPPSTQTGSLLFRRQTILPIPATYSGLNAGPDASTVVGVTLGSVAGFLLILWLIYTCINVNNGGGAYGGRTEVVEETIRRRSRSPRRHGGARSETIEIQSPPRRQSTRRETVIVEERIRPVEQEEDDDDIVEVIEEHSPPPRRESRRMSGYRNVDPGAYGGGGRPLRSVGGPR